MLKQILAILAFSVAATASAATYRRPIERVASMDPINSSSVPDSRCIHLVYDSLLEIDYVARPYRLAPGTCELPKISKDRLVYTFRMRDGIRFHDDPCFPDGKGRLANAHDIVYSLNRLRNPENAASGMWTMDYVSDVKATDGRTVVVTLKKPFHVFPWLMAMTYTGVVPHEAVEKYGSKFGQHPVGTGAYRLSEWWRNYRMVFTRETGWYGWPQLKNPAPFDRLEYVVVSDPSTQWLMFLGHELDVLGGIDRNNWDAVVDRNGGLAPELAAKGVTLLSAPIMQVMYVGFNMDDPLLGKNKKLRQALNCAFDAPAWKRFLNDRVEPADGPIPHGVDGRIETPFAYSFNVEKAKSLLAEAGFPGGVDPKTGKRLELPIALGRADQGAREEVELLQGFYDRVGVRLVPQFMTWAAYLKAVSDGHTTLFMLGWVGDYPDAENFLQLFHSKNCSPGANHGNYRNPEFDKCYDEAMAAETPEARRAAWARAQEIIREDCPWIFLYFSKSFSLVWNNVGNYRLTDFPYGMEKNLHQVPVPATAAAAAPLEKADYRYGLTRVNDVLAKECAKRGIVITDWHIHLRGGMTAAMAADREKTSGIRSGVLENHGREWPLNSNETLAAFIADAKKVRIDGRTMPVGVQVNDRDWYRTISPENRAALDYILADTMIMGTGSDGKPQRLWLLDKPITDPDAWMERYMEHNMRILDEPISILANPTYLPTCIAGEYDRLWTEERMKRVIAKAVKKGIALEIQAESPFPRAKFLKLAKKMGAKFSFGTNNFNPKPKDLSRWLEIIDWLDLSGDDIWRPSMRR